ncbi:MAG: hypothetical protein HOM85_04650 [Euryarchaeota archaeon]|nr:hypothetical protein [Euryarchaeota archaeon]
MYRQIREPTQGMPMMAPASPGSMEMGGMAAGGLGAPAGGMAAGGVAAAGGGMSVTTIAIVSVLVLGGAGTGGYFLYDYLTEPDFYGEMYWMENGFGYIFEDDGASLVFPNNNQGDWDCEDYGYGNQDSGDISEIDGICYVELGEEYESTDEGDYYRICLTEDGSETCIDIYPREQGAFMDNGGECIILVSDISPPNWDDEDLEEYRDTWQDEFEDVVDEIKEDTPSSCKSEDLDDDDGDLTPYMFDDRDAAGDLTDGGGEALVHVQMIQGDDISWMMIKVVIVVDDGHPIECYNEEEQDCEWTRNGDGDNYWSAGEEITILEGLNDLCDGSNGGCEIDITISRHALGDQDETVLAHVQAFADAN